MSDKNQLVASYSRVSSSRQENEKTIDSQISEVEKAISVAGDVLVKKYTDDGYSGELLERPALDQLRTDASKKLFSKIYILSPDRLARKHHHAAIILEDLSRYGIEVVFVNRPIGETMEDKLLFNVQSVFAEYEKAKILDRLRRGKLFKVNRGSVLGNTPPYGYNYIKDEKSRNGWYEINEKEAEIVRLIFSIYTSENCSGIGGVRRELYERNIKNRSGSSSWSQSMIARIVSNETYIGTTYWGKFKSVEGDSNNGYRRLKNTKRVQKAKEEWLAIEVPPIIDKDIFNKAEVRRATNKSLSPNKTKNPYLLRGLMSHSCGAKMYSKKCHGQKYYLCSARRNAFPQISECTDSRHYNGVLLEDLVWNEFRKIILSPNMLLRRMKQKIENKETQNQKIEQQILNINSSLSKIVEKRGRLLSAYSEGAITLQDLKTKMEEIDTENKNLSAEKNKLENLALKAQENPPEKVDLASFSEKIKESLNNADFLKRQIILRNFIDKITVNQDTALIQAVLPKELLVASTSTLS